MSLDGEVDVGIGVGLPALALQDPAGLATAAGVAATGHNIAELAMGILGILLEVAEVVEPLLVTQLHAAQVEHGILHGAGHLLALARLLAADDGRENANGQVHASVAVAKGRTRHGGRAIPEARGRGCAAGTLGHVLIDLQVFVMVTIAKALYRGHDHLRIELLDVLPGEAHAVEGARRKVLHHDVRLFDELLEHFLALRRFGVQGERTLVAVEHGEVEGIGLGLVPKLRAGDVTGARPLHLDDVCTEPGQQLRAGRAGLHMGEIDDLDALQGFGSRHASSPLVSYFLVAALVGFRLVIRPLSVPAVSSMMALIRVGLPERMASSMPARSSAGVLACTPTPPKASMSSS